MEKGLIFFYSIIQFSTTSCIIWFNKFLGFQLIIEILTIKALFQCIFFRNPSSVYWKKALIFFPIQNFPLYPLCVTEKRLMFRREIEIQICCCLSSLEHSTPFTLLQVLFPCTPERDTSFFGRGKRH